MKKITIIGAGAVGRSLALAMKRRGIRIDGIYSEVGRSARLLAKKCSVRNSGPLNGNSVLTDVIIIAVPDGAIPDVVRTILSLQRPLKGKVIVHTSGALTSDELAALRKKGASVGSFHPLQTFPKGAGASALEKSWFAIEGDPAAVRTCTAMAKKLGTQFFTVPKKVKTLYHIAAVFASNYQVTLFSVVEQLAGQAQVPKRDLWRIFRPLITRTMENVFTSSPAEALTGPIARGDYRTIMKHMSVLEASRSLKHIIPLYSALGVETAKLAKQRR